MLGMRVADDDGRRTFFILLRYVDGTLDNACGAAQKKLAAFGGKFTGVLDCSGLVHGRGPVLLAAPKISGAASRDGSMITQETAVKPENC
jgi:hypothetical protein